MAGGLILSGCGAVDDVIDEVKEELGFEDDPEIYALSIPSFIIEQSTVNIGGIMTDTNQSNFSYLWSSEDGSGTFGSPTSVNTTFTAPETEADRQITLTLSACSTENSGKCDAQSKTVTITPSSATNRPPIIQSISLDGETLDELESRVINAIVMDEDGDEMTYQWSATKGTFSDQTQLSTTFTAPSVASNEAITVTLSVSDGKKTNSLSIYVTVKDTANPTENNTPIIQSINVPTEIIDTDAPSINVLAYDPDSSDTLTYFWEANLGTIGSDESQKTTYTPPTVTSSTTETIKITVCDNHNSCISSSTDMVIKPASGEPQSNTDPKIESVYIPASINELASANLNVLALDDDTGDTLTYFWSATLGQFDKNDVQNPAYTAPDVSADISISIEVTVCDSKNSCVNKSQIVDIIDTNAQGTS